MPVQGPCPIRGDDPRSSAGCALGQLQLSQRTADAGPRIIFLSITLLLTEYVPERTMSSGRAVEFARTLPAVTLSMFDLTPRFTHIRRR